MAKRSGGRVPGPEQGRSRKSARPAMLEVCLYMHAARRQLVDGGLDRLRLARLRLIGLSMRLGRGGFKRQKCVIIGPRDPGGSLPLGTSPAGRGRKGGPSWPPGVRTYKTPQEKYQ